MSCIDSEVMGRMNAKLSSQRMVTSGSRSGITAIFSNKPRGRVISRFGNEPKLDSPLSTTRRLRLTISAVCAALH